MSQPSFFWERRTNQFLKSLCLKHSMTKQIESSVSYQARNLPKYCAYCGFNIRVSAAGSDLKVLPGACPHLFHHSAFAGSITLEGTRRYSCQYVSAQHNPRSTSYLYRKSHQLFTSTQTLTRWLLRCFFNWKSPRKLLGDKSNARFIMYISSFIFDKVEADVKTVYAGSQWRIEIRKWLAGAQRDGGKSLHRHVSETFLWSLARCLLFLIYSMLLFFWEMNMDRCSRHAFKCMQFRSCAISLFFLVVKTSNSAKSITSEHLLHIKPRCTYQTDGWTVTNIHLVPKFPKATQINRQHFSSPPPAYRSSSTSPPYSL